MAVTECSTNLMHLAWYVFSRFYY